MDNEGEHVVWDAKRLFTLAAALIGVTSLNSPNCAVDFGGDSFGGGLIYAMSQNYAPQKAIEFAIAASALKHSIEGDYNMVSVKEVETLVDGDASGRVQR